VCSLCKTVFWDVFDPEYTSSSYGVAEVKLSKFLGPDALLCPLCGSVNAAIPAKFRGRYDQVLRVQNLSSSNDTPLRLLYFCECGRFERNMYPKSWTSVDVDPKPQDDRLDSAASIVAYWLSNCLTTHEICRLNDRVSPWLPTRLIDQSNPRLVLTADLKFKDF
jgi:hypothetical protein